MKYSLPLLFFVVLFALIHNVTAATVYTDVPADHWAKTAIDWISAKGIMTGPAGPEPKFDPAGTVNRAEMATVITRLDSSLQAKIDELELRIAQLEQEGFLVEQLLNGPKR